LFGSGIFFGGVLLDWVGAWVWWVGCGGMCVLCVLVEQWQDVYGRAGAR